MYIREYTDDEAAELRARIAELDAGTMEERVVALLMDIRLGNFGMPEDAAFVKAAAIMDMVRAGLMTDDDKDFMAVSLMRMCVGQFDGEGSLVSTPTRESHANVERVARRLGLWDDRMEKWVKLTTPGDEVK